MNPRQMTCCFETLESRTLLSAVPIQDGLTAHLYSGSITLGGYTYFKGRDVAHGHELWRTDGTTAGTTLVKDLNPQAYGSYPQSFMVFNGRLLFTAQDGNQASDQALWRTDGTEAGTIKLFSNIDTSNGLEREGWYLFNGKLIGLGEEGLVETDGTPQGTRLIVADADSNSLVASTNRLYWLSGSRFTANYRVKSWDGQVVRVEATAGEVDTNVPTLASSFGYGIRFSWHNASGSSSAIVQLAPRELVVRPYQERFHNNNYNDNVEFQEMKFYNGADGGLWRVGAQPDQDVLVHSVISTGSLTISGDKLFFVDWLQLWRTDGTAEGTVLVKDFPGYPTGPRYLFGTSSDLYFVLEETPLVLQPWRSNGTTAGTVRAADVAPPGASQSKIHGLAQQGSSILVGARDRLWRIPTVPSPTRAPRPSLPSEVLRITGTGGNDDVRIGSFVQDGKDVTEVDVLGTR